MSDKINNGGPAFPLGPTAGTMKANPDGTLIVTHYGMESGLTLRDYFAAAALHGLMAYYGGFCDQDAKAAYSAADAMLKAREVKP